MTTPTPEAIEAAARALYVEQNWCTVNAELDEDPVPKSEYKRMAGLLWDKGGLGYENTKKYMRLGESAAIAAAPFIAAQAKAEALAELTSNSPRLPNNLRNTVFEAVGEVINEFNFPVQNMGIHPTAVEFGDVCGSVEKRIIAIIRAASIEGKSQ